MRNAQRDRPGDETLCSGRGGGYSGGRVSGRRPLRWDLNSDCGGGSRWQRLLEPQALQGFDRLDLVPVKRDLLRRVDISVGVRVKGSKYGVTVRKAYVTAFLGVPLSVGAPLLEWFGCPASAGFRLTD